MCGLVNVSVGSAVPAKELPHLQQSSHSVCVLTFTCFFSSLHSLRVQSQVDEVIDVMQENISKVIDRGERLEDLQDKSGETQILFRSS